MEKLEFTCPECGDHRLEEIMVDVVVATEVFGIIHAAGATSCTYGEQTNENGYVERYQCMECGFGLPDNVTDIHKLGKFLSELNS